MKPSPSIDRDAGMHMNLNELGVSVVAIGGMILAFGPMLAMTHFDIEGMPSPEQISHDVRLALMEIGIGAAMLAGGWKLITMDDQHTSAEASAMSDINIADR